MTGISATMTTTETTTGIVSSLRPAGMILIGSRNMIAKMRAKSFTMTRIETKCGSTKKGTLFP
jgi:hypothetical protein